MVTENPRRLTRLGVPMLLLLFFGSASGCASLGGSAPNPFDGGLRQAREDRLRIEVRNLNFNDITVYAVTTGRRVRLGTVTGKTDGNFRLEWNYAEAIGFQVDVIGGRGCNTDRILVDRGARVWVQVPDQLGSARCTTGRI